MSAPLQNLKQPRLLTAVSHGVAARYENAAFDDATLDAVADFLHRVNRLDRAVARAYVLWVDELVVYRDAKGAVRNAFGFRFLDVGDVGEQYRVLYSAFSAVDEKAGYTWAELGHVGMELFERECQLHARLPVIWATAFAGPAAEVFLHDRSDVHCLAPGEGGTLPGNLRFYSNEAPHDGLIGLVPPAVDQALFALLKEQQQLEADARQGRPLALPWWRRLTFPAAGLALTAALLMIGLSPRRAARDSDGLRLKGESATLHVYRQTAGGSEELLSGASLESGAKLGFGVEVASPSRVQIVGVEASGKTYVAWPLEGSGGTALVNPGPVQVLNGAVSLDGSTGRETLYLVTCPPNVTAARCTTVGPQVPLTCADACAASPFVIEKGGVVRLQE